MIVTVDFSIIVVVFSKQPLITVVNFFGLWDACVDFLITAIGCSKQHEEQTLDIVGFSEQHEEHVFAC